MDLLRRFIGALRKDFSKLTVATMVPSLLMDVLFIMINGFASAILRSPWYLIMCLYYIMLTFMRAGLLLGSGMKLVSRNKQKTDIRTYLIAHRMLLVMGMVLAIAVCFLIFHHVTRDYPGFLIYFVALYTLYKVTLSLINLFKANKTNSLTTLVIRKIGNIDALVSLLILESALMNRFGDPYSVDTFRINLLSGLGIWAIVMIMAASGVLKAKKMKKELKKEGV